MFKKLLNFLLLVPLTIAIITLAVANRHDATLVLDPLSPAQPMMSLQGPFFIFLFAALLTGILLGGIGMWFGQRKWRKAAQLRSREAHEWRREAERLGREATHYIESGKGPEALPSR